MSQKPRAYTLPLTVEFEDVDSLGIVHHTRLVAYLERARVHLLFEAGLGALSGQGPVAVLHDLTMRFLRPARLMDQLLVSVSPRESDGVTLALDYEIRRGSELLATATTVIAFWDRETVVPVPEPVLASLAAWGAA